MPFLSESFDGVVCVATMHHIRGKLLKSVMHEISRVLKPNGRVVIWDHNRINPYWLFLMKRVPQDQGKEQIHSSGHLIQLLEDAGIKTIVYEKKGFMPDFIPIFLMRLFSFLERGIEKIPLLNLICSHNVIIGEKNVER